MQVAIRATHQQKEELIEKSFNNAVIVNWVDKDDSINHYNADAYFNLSYNDENYDFEDGDGINDKIVFVHAVNTTCKEFNKKNYIRLNAWQGFLNRNIIELACCDENYKQAASKIFNALNWKYVFVADDYGLVAARIIAMIINEAYYALQENVSSKAQIDIAMKLGTNYPYGPFEWSEKIGIKNIYKLLQKLSTQNKRYTIAEALQRAAADK